MKRIWKYKNNLVDGFTKEYKVYQLVHFELHEEMISAILREKQIKKWNRLWKLRLIEKTRIGRLVSKFVLIVISLCPCVERRWFLEIKIS